MNGQFEFKPNLSRGNFCVAKLPNSRAIGCVSRLELDHFRSAICKWQLDPPSFNQKLHKNESAKIPECN